MFQRISWLLFTVLCTLAHADLGSSSGGGGGIAEKNVVFAYLNLPRYLALCLGTPACRLDDNEQALLRKIADALPREGDAKKLLHFRSGQASPGFFILDGGLKIAKTGYRLGEPIYFNTDLLYSPRPLRLTSAVALLVHELGHHQGVTDHEALDLLGSRVETFLLKRSQQIGGEPLLTNVVVTAIDPESEHAFSQLLVSDGDKLFDLSGELKKAIRCPSAVGMPVGATLYNLHWVGFPRPSQSPSRQRVQGRLILNCSLNGTYTSPIVGLADLTVDIELIPGTNGESALTGKFETHQVDCPNNGCH